MGTTVLNSVREAGLSPPGNGKERPARVNIQVWTPLQKFAFRVAFIFFIVLSIPFTPAWWNNLLTLDWLHPNYRDIYIIARFLPDVPFIPHYSKGLKSYNDWFVILLVALIGSVIWGLIDRKRKEYNKLYYWLGVIMRYRAGIGMVGFGMQKIFPVQMAYPPVSILNTSLGDMTMQKLYWWEIGISPFYQSFTGFVEFGSGVLLFYRKTTFWGAALLFGALGAVNFVNVAYDGNVHVYSTYFVIYAMFLMIYYARDIYNLQFRERITIPQHYYPSFRKPVWKYTRIGLKALNIAVFLILLPYLQYLNFVYDPYNQPSTPGVSRLRGLYNVTEFRINGKEIPYSPMDSVRWQQAIFEKWSTLSFKVNLPIPDNISGRMQDPGVRKYVGTHGFDFNSGAPVRDIDRTYEIFAANQRSFYYRADTVGQVLYLQDKSPYTKKRNEDRYASVDPANRIYKADWIPAEAKKNMVGEIEGIPKAGRSTRRTRAYNRVAPLDKLRDRMILKYQIFQDGKRVMLTGINESSDSIRVILDRADKKYLLPESKLIGGKY